MKILFITLMGCILSGVLYRLGGAAKKGDWLDFLRNTKTRDWGCPLVIIGMANLFGISIAWYWQLLSFGLMWAALTTYWDEIFGYDNFYAHGLMVGLACVPFAIAFGGWIWFWLIIRAIILGAMMGIWCDIFSYDITEEVGRGAFIALTLPVLFVGLI